MSIRFASYNLWNGAASSYFRLLDFAKSQSFDVLCLQEVNGWQDKDFERMKDFADRTDYNDYEFGNSNSEYKMVTLSMLPVTFRDVHVEGFWHCVIETYVKVGDMEISVFNIHLDPWKEDPRLREVQRLLELIDLSKPTIITGDFNSVSRQDNYPPEFLTELQKRKFYKFGQSELDFRVTDFLADAGFVDVAAHFGKFDTTVPSPFGTNEVHDEIPASEAPARLDYFFVSDSLVPMLRDFEVIKSHETDKISDHYPIVLTLDAGDASAEARAPELVVDKPAPAQPPDEAETQTSDAEVEIKLH